MPTQAFPKEQCVVDRRRKRRRATERPEPLLKKRPTAKAAPPAEPDEPAERRKVERRGKIDPTTCERDYAGDEVEFMTAMDDYKRRSGRMFPTWSEVLEVLRDLGYRKVAEPTQTYTGEE